jgi:prepilin-type N-terminal cleavage/methylation domain-containing protein
MRKAKLKGFSLIEMLVVMAIIGLVMAVAYPQYQVVSHSNLRLSTRQLAGAIKYLYARAALDKKPWRLAMDFEKNKYWGERLTENSNIQEQVEKKNKDNWVKPESISSFKPGGWTSNISPATNTVEYVKTSTITLKETPLPKGVIFRDVRVIGRDKIAENIGYIYFSPYGGVERAIIHLKHEKHNWVYTLVTKPLSGRVAIFDKDLEIENVPMTGRVRE